MNLILIAPPAAGKGTMASMLHEKYGLVCISAGELLRGVDPNTELGKEIRDLQSRRELVDDRITNQLMKERLMFQNAPHVRQSESVVTMMTDVIVALLPIYLIAFFYHGARSIVLGLVGVISCCLLSLIGSLLLREKPVLDFTPVITGLIIPLLLPADIPYYIVFSACAVAIFVVKIPFGGTGNNLFRIKFYNAHRCFSFHIKTYVSNGIDGK